VTLPVEGHRWIEPPVTDVSVAARDDARTRDSAGHDVPPSGTRASRNIQCSMPSSSAAYHESGHALAAMRWLGHTPRSVSIGAAVPGKSGSAQVEIAASARSAHSDARWRRIRVPEAAMFVAGLAAEEVAGYGRSRGISNLESILRVQGPSAVNQILTQGMLPPVEKATDDVEGALAALVDAFPSKRDLLARVLRVYSFVGRFLAASRLTLDRLAADLTARGTLSEAEIETVVGDGLPYRRPR
jgi:hypothetical protein